MKRKILFTFAVILFTAVSAFAQRPTAATTTINPATIQRADPNDAKIKKLEEEVAALQNELKALNAKFTELQKDNGALKFTMVGVNNSLGTLKTDLTGLQNNYNNFTTVTYPAHTHKINGIAGNTYEGGAIGIKADASHSFDQMRQWARTTTGVSGQ